MYKIIIPKLIDNLQSCHLSCASLEIRIKQEIPQVLMANSKPELTSAPIYAWFLPGPVEKIRSLSPEGRQPHIRLPFVPHVLPGLSFFHIVCTLFWIISWSLSSPSLMKDEKMKESKKEERRKEEGGKKERKDGRKEGKGRGKEGREEIQHPPSFHFKQIVRTNPIKSNQRVKVSGTALSFKCSVNTLS